MNKVETELCILIKVSVNSYPQNNNNSNMTKEISWDMQCGKMAEEIDGDESILFLLLNVCSIIVCFFEKKNIRHFWYYS